MSIEIDWKRLTTGPDAAALAESIRAFLDDRFQQLPLPHFIRAVRVTGFDLGSVAPEVELKDLGDPLAEFYESDGEDDEADAEEVISGAESIGVTESIPTIAEAPQASNGPVPGPGPQSIISLASAIHRPRSLARAQSASASISTSARPPRSAPLPDLSRTGRLNRHPFLESLTLSSAPSPFPRSHNPTPSLTSLNAAGIPGGTANLHHFNSPLASGFAPQPFGALARGRDGGVDGGGYFHASASGRDGAAQTGPTGLRRREDMQDPFGGVDGPTDHIRAEQSSEEQDDNGPEATDTQAMLRIRYAGDVKLSLAAELLLDYPMPAFMGIPLRMQVTGVSFDGIAVVAYVGGRRVCVCFLGGDEAGVFAEPEAEGQAGREGGEEKGAAGSLLREIKVESEIGLNEGGKPGLKNMGKVEKFVLEQVRKIFDEELVYPSFWTFLI
ncbi:MAG: Mitochondrial distribution and morphology protein 12 [Vezdaea aestivalis]|nr:MAG: Mitochondrial distribution and morphology protein 12 [Vezdaea aestivalis]